MLIIGVMKGLMKWLMKSRMRMLKIPNVVLKKNANPFMGLVGYYVIEKNLEITNE